MGAVDLVVQVESPGTVASGLQRVGRAGHQVGVPSVGTVFPKYRGDLVECAVVARGMRQGAVETTRLPRTPLDVLAQQVVAMVAVDDWPVARLHAVLRARPRTRSSRGASSRGCSTCSRAGTPPTSSPSCGRGSSGTGSRTWYARARAPNASP